MDSKEGSRISIIRTIKALKIARVLRIATVTIRLKRFMVVLRRVGEILRSKTWQAAIAIATMLTYVGTINHYVACGWYFVGTLKYEDQSWLREERFDSATPFYLYVASSRWSIAQFTPAPNNNHPTNFIEECYALCVVFCGIAIFSSCLGSLTTTFTALRQSHEHQAREQTIINRYIIDNALPSELSSRILNFMRNRDKGSHRVIEADAVMFKQLPETLLIEMRHAVYRRFLTQHELFEVLEELHIPFFMEVCFGAMSEMRMQASLEIFRSGKDAKGMLFVAGGKLEYFFEDEEDTVQELRVFDWASEAVLWTRWLHRGRLVSIKDCDLMWLNSAVFRDIAQRNVALSFLKRYALRFVENLIQAEKDGAVYDVWKLTAFGNGDVDPGDAEPCNEAVYNKQREEQRSLVRKSVQLAQADRMSVTTSDLGTLDDVAIIDDDVAVIDNNAALMDEEAISIMNI